MVEQNTDADTVCSYHPLLPVEASAAWAAENLELSVMTRVLGLVALKS